MEKTRLQILLVEDNPADVFFLREALACDTLADFDLMVAESLGEALALLSAQTFAAALLDLGLPDSQGLPTFLKLLQSAPDLPVVVLSALADEDLATQAIQAGAQDYLIKRPQDFPSAGRALRYAIERHKIHAELLASEEKFHSVVACTPDIIFTVDRQNLIQFINRVPAGLTTEEAVGTSALAYVHPEYRGCVEEAIRSVFETGRETSYEIQARGPNDTVAWFSTRLTSLNRGAADEQVLLITQDITERMQALEKIHESEVLLRQVLESSRDSIFAIDRDYRLLVNNARHQQVLVMTGGHPFRVGESVLSPAYPPEVSAYWLNLYDRAFRGEEFNWETEWLYSDGQQHTNESSFSPLRDATGTIVGALVVIHDITERKHAYERVRDSEEKYRGLMETLDSVVATVDYDGKFLYMNEVAAQQMGSTPQALVGKTMDELFPEPVASQQMAIVRQVIQTDQGHVSENLSFVHGQERWYRSSLQPIHDGGGRVAYALLHATDIHELKSTQQALAELNRTLEERVKKATAEIEDLYENAPAGYHSLDVDGKIVRINQTELNWLGYSREELLGQPFTRLLTPASLATFRTIYPLFMQRGWLQDLEMEFLRKDGSILYTLVNASAVRDDNAGYLMSRSTVFDITHRKQAEQALREREGQLRISRDKLSAANAALEKAAHMKDEFLASMSHELRTPLTGILVLSESMQFNTYGTLTEKQNEVLKHIEESGHHLLNLINDILDLSKIAAGMLELDIEPISLAEICQASLQLTKGMAHKKQQTVSFAMPPNNIEVCGDARRLKQMLVNLLSNAIKFTPQNGSLGLEVQADQAGQVVRLIVWDTGIGIAPENLELLFQPFVQLEGSLARQYEGTGLGLSLVQRMAELHGGSVQVESSLGQGSRFTILLPWMPAEPLPISGAEAGAPFPKNAAPTPSSRSTQPMVLIVDDNELTIETISDFLRLRSFRVAATRSALELLDVVADLQPDLILMDIQMPVMDGFEATRRIRSHSDSRVARIPIIALTALAMRGDRERCLAAGTNEYLSKPVGLEQLMATIHRLLGRV